MWFVVHRQFSICDKLNRKLRKLDRAVQAFNTSTQEAKAEPEAGGSL